MTVCPFGRGYQPIRVYSIILAGEGYAGTVLTFCRDREIFKGRSIAVTVNHNTGAVFACSGQGNVSSGVEFIIVTGKENCGSIFVFSGDG
ncbi:hypothetical protein [Chimaeribacter coloradensis]|uniref:hypothetical protein n=1 Tax=Chimaeribacter coloradensis TaxID=2060068 RepID=UPI0013FD0261|nr:hypothetical protein [Chimaeribacter coloradensis]